MKSQWIPRLALARFFALGPALALGLGLSLQGCLPGDSAIRIDPPATEPPSLSVQGISDSATPVQSKTWVFTCSTIPCRFRKVINTSPSHTFSLESYGSLVNSDSATKSGVTGTYYLHVQAQDASGNESEVKSVSAPIDNTAPVLTNLSNDSTPKASLSWSWGCDESTPCLYRFVIDQASATSPSGQYVSTSSALQGGSSGTYYLHIQARDEAGNVSGVQHFSGVISSDVYSVSGSVLFDWVPSERLGTWNADGLASGRINYAVATKEQRPARRVMVEAIRNSDQVVLSTTRTNDAGAYSLDVPLGQTVKVRVHARMLASNYVKDGVPGSPESCNGASWDVRVVDNTQNRAQYALTSSSTYSAAASGVNFTPQLVFNSTTGLYTSREAAPFALLDTIIRGIERVCEANPAVLLPLLYVNWSSNNVDESPQYGDADADGTLDDKELGKIGTSHYTVEMVAGVPRPNLYILGKEDSDTDEYDDHVVAHEFGHFLEDQLYRSDSIGGGHWIDDSLDPRVAFGEGYGNAFSAITFDNATYVDTSGENQAAGFSMNVAAAPKQLSRGVYTERSAHYFLWNLFKNRSSTYDRIHTVLASDHRTTPAMTTLHSFASYYRTRFGAAAESMGSLWSDTLSLSSPLDALCSGACPANLGGTQDLFDSVDRDLGTAYASKLRYPATSTGNVKSASFWNLYAPLVSGSNVDFEHNTTSAGGYGYSYNKAGMNRWYRYRPSASGVVTIKVSAVAGLTCPTTQKDVLDMVVFRAGEVVDRDETASGCPTVSFSATAGVDYVVIVSGYDGDASNFTITVTP